VARIPLALTLLTDVILLLIYADRYEHAGVFPGKMCSDRRKDHGCGHKKEGISSAIFGVGTAANCCELKRCADRGRSRTDNKNEVLEGKFRHLNFSPFPKKTTEYSFELFL